MIPAVECDKCGKAVRYGYMEPNESRFYCFDCGEERWRKHELDEFRICHHCGKPMTDGMTDLFNFYAHEGKCFEACMDLRYPDGWRENLHEGEDIDGDTGYYDAYNRDTGEWEDAGIFYTDWLN